MSAKITPPRFTTWAGLREYCEDRDHADYSELTCGELVAVYERGDPPECEGHPAGPFDPMGETVYCDGSCRADPPARR